MHKGKKMIRIADLVAKFLISKGISDGFSVVGGGAMYLNDAFGHIDGLHMIYNHHEQASSMAAESYARLNNKPALVCVTTGPGGINALTGIACAYLDSLPMYVVTGQVRYDTTSRYLNKKRGTNIRAIGDQEYDIVESAKRMTKYAVMIEDPDKILYELEKAYDIMMSDRMGPVLIDIPVNFQGMEVDEDKLPHYESKNNIIEADDKYIDLVIDEIKKSKRPVLYAGYGIRLSGGYDIYKKVINKLNIPICTYFNAIDLIETDNDLYVGRGGNMGDRAGNFAIQNADLVLAVGTRLSIRQVGYNYKTWARCAKVIMVDIDKNEFEKETIHVDYKIHSDAKIFFEKLDKKIKNDDKLFNDDKWLSQVKIWKEKYPVVDKKKYEQIDKVNVYAFMDTLSKILKEDSLVVVSNGACCVAGSQSFIIKKGTRFHNNSALASMGYGLPASIGACISNKKKNTICLEGDGSIMMNLQELQTIITNKLPIKIFMINNEGYQSIRITQSNIFGSHTKVGIGPESKDLSFPDFKKVASAFGFPYYQINNNNEMEDKIKNILSKDGYSFTEIFTDTKQVWQPKNSAKKIADHTIVSPPLEDLEPFLSKEELESNMYIDLIEGGN